MRLLRAISVVVCLSILPSSLVAASYDGSVPLLCAAMTVLECAEDTGACQQRTAASVELPAFITIDFDKKLLRAMDQQDRTSPLKHVEHVNGQLVLHGGEAGRGWSMVIQEDTGTLSAAVVGEQIGFVIFGACTPR